MATVEEICRFHDRSYVDHIKALSDDNGGDAGGLTPFGPGSYEIALLAAGGVMAACDAVLDGDVDNIYALVRPPGHHALAGEGMGFCLFGNVAIAAHHLRSSRGLERVAIVDWDVHHGNGTQSAFYDDASVLTISFHQDGCFPLGSGAVGDNGEGEGAGANINVPLPRGGGRGAYVAAFERVVVPALERFSPDLILVASGLDASAMDPLGRMQMHSDGYRELTKLMQDVAGRGCEGRLVAEHEGGYSSAYVPFCGLAIVEELSGLSSGVEDPMLEFIRAQGGDDLAPHEDEVIALCEALIEKVPAALAPPRLRSRPRAPRRVGGRRSGRGLRGPGRRVRGRLRGGPRRVAGRRRRRRRWRSRARTR